MTSPLRRFFTHNVLLKLLSLALAVAIYWAVHR
jgi:hypothetical protein